MRADRCAIPSDFQIGAINDPSPILPYPTRSARRGAYSLVSVRAVISVATSPYVRGIC